MDVADLIFEEVDAPQDAIPPMSDIEYPCAKCGREIIYGGRGRKPTASSLCTDCKPRKASTVKLTGNASNLAAQAAKTLVQINQMMAMLGAAVGFFATAGQLAAYQETFEAQAFTALSTDLELCRAILRTGSKSAKVSLALAYGGMAIAVGPTAMMEFREKKLAREAEGVAMSDV